MVGGKVREIVEQENRIWLDVQDVIYPKDFCALYIERNKDSEQIQIGDSVWWQGKFLLWTPKDGSREDVEIPRLSYSGVGVPDNYFSAPPEPEREKN